MKRSPVYDSFKTFHILSSMHPSNTDSGNFDRSPPYEKRKIWCSVYAAMYAAVSTICVFKKHSCDFLPSNDLSGYGMSYGKNLPLHHRIMQNTPSSTGTPVQLVGAPRLPKAPFRGEFA